MKQVIIKKPSVSDFIEPNQANPRETYICRFSCGWGKLHRINNYRGSYDKSEDFWAFIDLSNSNCYMNGVFQTMQQAIKAAMNSTYQVYEFATWEEAMKYMMKRNGDF